MTAVAATKALHEAVQLARSGRLDAASAALQGVLAKDPEHTEALQLLGLVRRNQGNPVEAEALLRRALDADPGQAHACNNLGNVLRDQGRDPEASECYRRALALDPAYVDARLNLGITLFSGGDAAAALACFERVTAASPGHAKAWTCRGNALKRLDRHPEAEQAYRRALSLNPEQVTALHNLGLLCKRTGRVDEALELLHAAARLAPRKAEIHYNRGHALLAAGRLDDALNAWGIAIRLEPAYAEAHDTLNKVLWQHGRDGYLASYAWAVEQAPGASALWVDWADKLVLAGRGAEAVRHLERAIAGGASAAMHHRLGRALAVTGRPQEAEAHFAEALAMAPASTRFLLDLARLQIVQGRYEEAERQLDRALQLEPDDQEAIAYRGVCWRLRGDARERVLNDCDRYVRTFRLPPPPGYASIGEFNRDLQGALERLHRTTAPPAEQSLRGGTQTLDDLFAIDLPQVDALRRMLEQAVAEYVRGIDGDPSLPLVRRRTGGFRFSGSWSVRLRPQGYHVNHVHPEGWISSCYYVAVPPCVADEHDRQGWLRFGETSLRRGEREQVARSVRPEAGVLVLFPSFFFHGTTPFADESERVTVAFDAVPEGPLEGD